MNAESKEACDGTIIAIEVIDEGKISHSIVKRKLAVETPTPIPSTPTASLTSMSPSDHTEATLSEDDASSSSSSRNDTTPEASSTENEINVNDVAAQQHVSLPLKPRRTDWQDKSQPVRLLISAHVHTLAFVLSKTRKKNTSVRQTLLLA